jgi:sulfur-carrier protein
MIRVVLPSHLRKHANINGEVAVEIEGAATQQSLLDALEKTYPVLRGTIRDHDTKKRRAFLRFYACQRDISHDAPDAPLPEEVVRGSQPFLIVGAIAGG